AEKLLLKVARLARLAGSEEVGRWLYFEMQGYSANDPTSLFYMTKTGRWVDRKTNSGWWGPLGQHEAAIEVNKAQLEASRLASVSGEMAATVVAFNNKNQNNLNSIVNQLAGIRSRVIGMLHDYVTGVYYERQFANLAESTFEGYKREVDALIAEKAGQV